MKAKNDSIHYLAILTVLSLVLFAHVGHAQTTDTSTSTDPSSTTTAASSGDSSSSNSLNGNSDSPDRRRPEFRRSDRSRQNKRIFYLGVCSGQVLAKQGTYLSDIESGATSANEADLKAAIKSAIQTCKEQAKARQNSGSTTATPTPTATPVPTATPTSATATTATSGTTTTASEY